ncbi:MAG: YpfJ protein, zinc metalloprotease superfamily [uncultured Thermomicrobiales bacterium]|uniref:YpfJ protein, zinc metalloprotease superfamily n=1 Tax=uncultured Thermomicrobiales bacterium TaxID=1645740 RepID=A0A6J4V7I8_9BACT|nr:MAG: YpfJ protein, zinc metalloprotease superfamily [uncultured Thermomicrobiales bacterium]
MPGAAVPVLALLLLVAAPLAPAPAPVGAATVGQSYDEVTQTVIAEVDAFWGRAFAAADLAYASPTAVAVDGPLTTACGPADSSTVAASYCGADQTIYYTPSFFLQAEREIGNFAWITVLAHEWGHHVQNLLGVERLPGNRFELQADCLAGAYARDAEARGLLEPGDITEATGMSAAGGDPIWLPQDELGAHGTNDDRIKAFMRGNLDGVVGCALPVALAAPSDVIVGGTTPSVAAGLFGLLPTGDDVVAGSTPIEEGGRTLEEIAATFPDPVDAAHRLATWGFQENAYRTFVPADGVGLFQVSLHRFGSAAAAAQALPYYADGRAAVLGLVELPTRRLGDQTIAVGGPVAEGSEVTLYVRRSDVLIRVSATVPTGDPAAVARDAARAVLAKPLVELPAPRLALADLLPTAAQLPPGLLPTEEGARSEAEITASFPDPVDAAQRFVTWGWRENAYRSFAAPDGDSTASGTTSLEVSLHRFASAAGAAEALPYYADGRAVSLGLREIPFAPIGDGARAVGGTVAAGEEVTIYAWRGDLLVRVSAVAAAGDPTADALAVAEAVVANAA